MITISVFKIVGCVCVHIKDFGLIGVSTTKGLWIWGFYNHKKGKKNIHMFSWPGLFTYTVQFTLDNTGTCPLILVINCKVFLKTKFSFFSNYNRLVLNCFVLKLESLGVCSWKISTQNSEAANSRLPTKCSQGSIPGFDIQMIVDLNLTSTVHWLWFLYYPPWPMET